MVGGCVGKGGADGFRRPWVGATAFLFFHARRAARVALPTHPVPSHPIFERSPAPLVAPTHGRRIHGAMGGDGCRRPWVGATAFLFFYARRAARAALPTHPVPSSSGGLGSADPWSADPWGNGGMDAADHGSALPLFSFSCAAGGKSFSANPFRPIFDRSPAALVAPTHGRRMRGGMGADGFHRPGIGAAAFLFFSYAAGGHGTCQGAGRWGWAGALSAMDGAKRGTQGCGCCRPPPSPTARPTQGCASKQAAARGFTRSVIHKPRCNRLPPNGE